MIQGAIFDLDGTLLDSMQIWDTLGETYLRSLGYEPKEDINALFRTFSLRQAAEHYRSAYGVPMTAEELMAGINRSIAEQYYHTIPLKAGVRPFLEQLSGCGVRMCIATATDRPLAEAAIERLGIAGYFSDLLTCTEVGHGKDEPQIYRTALERLGTDKRAAAVFEDALFALETAKREGFVTVGIYDSCNPEQQELRAAADVYLDDFLHPEPFWNFVGRR